MPTSTLLTIDDFERLPADVAEGHELVDGELVDVSGNTPLHNKLRDRLNTILHFWVSARSLGEVSSEQGFDFMGNAHGPDVSFYGPAKLPHVDNSKRVQRFVPDFAIEIASPRDTYQGLMKKKDRYLRAGTREVWLVSPETREILVCAHDRIHEYRMGDTTTTDLLPGFQLKVDELFRCL